MTTSNRRLPPLAWVAIGAALQRLLTGDRGPSQLSKGLAGLITAGSVGMLGWSVASFRRNDTTVDPLDPGRAAHLVDDGPFRLTRNPMYVGMAGTLLAHAVARRSFVALLPVGGFVGLMDATQIQAEERAMQAKFGPDWDRYAATTPRWLSLRSLRN